MAVLGFQLVTTLVAASVLSKIVTYFSFTRFLYDGLVRCVVPTDEQLLNALGNHKLKYKNKKRRSEQGHGGSGVSGTNGDSDVFYFPRTMPIPLKLTGVSHTEAVTLPLYSSCQWLLDFTVCTIGVYLITEAAQSPLMPWYQQARVGNFSNKISNSTPSLSTAISFNTRINLSLVWLSLTVWFTLRTLLSMTGIYFRRSNPDTSRSDGPSPSAHNSNTANQDSSTAEWLLVLSAGFIFLVITGFVLALDGRYFEFNLHLAYGNLTLDTQPATNSPLITWGAFQSILALTCALIGAVYVYPGLKFGKIYVDMVNNDSVAFGKRLLLHLTFIAPLFPIMLWVQPVTKHIVQSLISFTHNPWVSKQPALLVALTVVRDLLSVHLGTLRLLACLIVVLLRFFTTRWNLQTYLNSAKDKLDRFNREPGRTSNREVQRLVASIFYCINLVALQYIAPTIMLLAMVCLYKTVAGLSWFPAGLFTKMEPMDSSRQPPVNSDLSSWFQTTSTDPDISSSWFSTVTEARIAFSQLTDILAVRGMAVARGVFGFLVWWCLVALQLVSLLGLAYHRFASV